MTHLKFKNHRPVGKSFNNLMDDFFVQWPSIMRDEQLNVNTKQQVPVNIKETEAGYELEVVAPGFEKEEFKIALDKKVLSISVERNVETEAKEEKYLRSEYKFQTFKRSFTIDENIDEENINAQYVNGVLKLNLPKKNEIKAATKNISIQ